MRATHRTGGMWSVSILLNKSQFMLSPFITAVLHSANAVLLQSIAVITFRPSRHCGTAALLRNFLKFFKKIFANVLYIYCWLTKIDESIVMTDFGVFLVVPNFRKCNKPQKARCCGAFVRKYCYDCVWSRLAALSRGF